MLANREYSASDIRRLLQELFPHRRLVLSQFTFFHQVGVSKPTGETSRRGRRCYRLQDVLSIACVLALKEEGIPLKNIEQVPRLVQENTDTIFRAGENCRLSGSGEVVTLQMPWDEGINAPLELLLTGQADSALFWSFDVGLLSIQLGEIAQGQYDRAIRRAA